MVVIVGLAGPEAARAADLLVSTDFEGGSARVESIDQAARVIAFMPGGDPARGWPCWWYFRVDGAVQGESIILSLAASDLPVRNSGKDTGKPLAAGWAMPARASVSVDGQTWRPTEPGVREGTRMRYEVTGTSGPVWVAWGPPFTPLGTDALLAAAETVLPDAATSFELARTREGRAVRGIQVSEAGPGAPGVWVQARQHAWESGGSWVARGFLEWLIGADEDARWLRGHAEVFLVPIMDADNVATGNGGKEADPRDQNRDWCDTPVFPEVAAAQARLRALAAENRLHVFIDLHNPAASDFRPFFFVGPPELLTGPGLANRDAFLACARRRITDPMVVAENPRVTGPAYHPLWQQISGQWVNAHGNPHTVAVCLETPWNTPASTTEGYRAVGRQLGQAVAEYLGR